MICTLFLGFEVGVPAWPQASPSSWGLSPVLNAREAASGDGAEADLHPGNTGGQSVIFQLTKLEKHRFRESPRETHMPCGSWPLYPARALRGRENSQAYHTTPVATPSR